MSLENYLIDQEGKDWFELLSGWLDLFPESFTIWFVNLFGNVVVVFDDGSVHLLDVGTGAFKRIANSREHLAALSSEGNNARDWLSIDLADQCVAAGMTLAPNQCYGYKVPPILGGKYEVENVEPTDLSVHYSLLAQICSQAKTLPDGTRVRISMKK